VGRATRLSFDVWASAVGALFAVSFGAYAELLFWRYDIFRAGVDDGIFTQIANGAFAGFSSTVEGGANHFLVHFSPILYLTVPFVRLFNGPHGLDVLQALLTAAIVFPIWNLAATRFSKPIAFTVTLVAACYPPLAAEAVGDFHELAFAPVLTACLVLALDRRAFRYVVAVAIVLLCVKEDQSIALAFIGVLVAATSRQDPQRRRAGFVIAAMSITVALFYFFVLRRLIDPAFPYWSFHFYQWWSFPHTSPLGFAGLTSAVRPLYVFAAFAPLAFLPFGSRYVWFAMPGFAEVLLSHEAMTMTLSTHYTATWSGYLLCAFVDGAYSLSLRSAIAAKVLVVAAFAASVWTSIYRSPVNPGYSLYRRPTAEDRERDRDLQALPRSASVWSNDPIFAHLGMNPQASTTMKGQDYLVFDLTQDAGEFASPAVRHLIASGSYSLDLQKDGIAILRRRK
jgi:uncharacterized membrane protein